MSKSYCMARYTWHFPSTCTARLHLLQSPLLDVVAPPVSPLPSFRAAETLRLCR